MNDTAILTNRGTPVKMADGTTVSARLMAWPDTIEFLTRLGAEIKSLVNAEGNISFDFHQLPELIQRNAALCEFLVARSTGHDEAWVKQRDVGEMLDLLDAALAENLSEEIVARAKKLAGRLRSTLGKTTSAAPLTS